MCFTEFFPHGHMNVSIWMFTFHYIRLKLCPMGEMHSCSINYSIISRNQQNMMSLIYSGVKRIDGLYDKN